MESAGVRDGKEEEAKRGAAIAKRGKRMARRGKRVEKKGSGCAAAD